MLACDVLLRLAWQDGSGRLPEDVAIIVRHRGAPGDERAIPAPSWP